MDEKENVKEKFNISDRTWNIFQKILDQPSLHPDLKRKSRDARLNDLIRWLKKYRYINSDYNELGMDIEGFCNEEEYLDHFRAHLDALKNFNFYYLAGSPVPRPINAVLSDDKYVFHNYIESIHPGITPKIYMYIFCGGKTYNEFGEYEDVFSAMEKLPDGKYVCKPVLGQCGRDIIVITVNGGQVVLGENITLSELKVNFEKEDYIVQEFLTQHESMAALNKSSVNTVRITTTRFNENAYLFTAMARIGIGDTLVDNAAAGGTCVGIDLETGKLMKFGCYHDKPKETRHPITGIEYEGFQIPFWEESTQIVKHLHRFYKGFPSLGWDVAITPEGPKIIENNYDWAFGIMQQIHGGLKKRWEQAKSLK